jgi:two-component system LytT family sensor kinase
MATLSYRSRYLVKKVLHHAIWWIIFIVYELILNYYISRTISPSTPYFYVLNILLFYCHSVILSKTLGGPRISYFNATCLILLELVLVMCLKTAGEYLFGEEQLPSMGDHDLFIRYFVMDFARSVFYIGLSTLYWYRGNVAGFRKQSAKAAIRGHRMARDKAELETSLANARNAFLQQQLNPHLIFNTLNLVYNAVYKTSATGGRAVLLLSEILGFSLSKTDENGRVPLAAELEQIGNLVEINRCRYHYPLDITFRVQGDPGRHRILPLILLTLAENVFKHGDFQSKPASILLAVDETGLLRFNTENAGGPRLPGQGIGIRNIRLRLDHSYPGKYSLVTGEDGQTFRADLTLQL